ncbi:peptidylprolyl isomerase [Ectothiorhodospiraceae bacterium BW-2]|nr:peptidylprolyl isomerase [Ectothiorhodospiraceae bacterium BW-2]
MGEEITIDFRLTLTDGTLIDESGEEPLRFTLGDGSLLPAFEQRILPLPLNEPHTLLFTPEEAFGHHDPDNLHWLPLSSFSEPPLIETVMAFTLPDGQTVPATIVEIVSEQVRVDFNHPLAGQPLLLWLRVVDRESR